mgnify:CR=1 FL=1
MARKDRFEKAIVESLEALIKEGKKITKTAVIDRAKFDDGTAVGKSTLYSRNSATGEFVHAALLRTIDEATAKQRRGEGRCVRPESISGLKKAISDLKQENEKLIDQVVEQESRLTRVSGDRLGDKNTIALQEGELYVLASIINKLTQNSVYELVELSRRYSLKYRGDSRLQRADEEVDRYIDELNRSKFLCLSADRGESMGNL